MGVGGEVGLEGGEAAKLAWTLRLRRGDDESSCNGDVCDAPGDGVRVACCLEKRLDFRGLNGSYESNLAPWRGVGGSTIGRSGGVVVMMAE
jgi:hypothetical protein